jgi:hypothetical protein
MIDFHWLPNLDFFMTKLLLVTLVLVLVTFAFGSSRICGELGVVLSVQNDIELEQQTCAGCATARKELLAKKAIFCQLTCPNLKENGCSNKSFLITLEKHGLIRGFFMEKRYQKCIKESAKINVKNCICQNLKLPLFAGLIQLKVAMKQACQCASDKKTLEMEKTLGDVEGLEIKAHTLESNALELENSATALESE